MQTWVWTAKFYNDTKTVVVLEWSCGRQTTEVNLTSKNVKFKGGAQQIDEGTSITQIETQVDTNSSYVHNNMIKFGALN